MMNFDKQKVFQAHPSRPNGLLARESSTIEFKEAFNWNAKDMYGKTAAAFANNKGGFLIFGVKDNPYNLVGLLSTNFEEKDEADIAEFFNTTFAPEIHFRKYTEVVRRKTVGIIEISPAERKPVVCLKNVGILKESEIYWRYIARSEKIKYPELQQILESEREKVEEKWRNLLKNIGRISDVERISVLDESSGQPIRITDDPNAPVVRIEEDPTIGGYILLYRDILTEMRKRSRLFKANKKFNELMRELKEDEQFCKTRLLYPGKPNGAKAQFFHPRILDELLMHYT